MQDRVDCLVCVAMLLRYVPLLKEMEFASRLGALVSSIKTTVLKSCNVNYLCG